MIGGKTRTVRCNKCKEGFDQTGTGEDGCFSQTFWTPNECPNCGADKTNIESPVFLISIYLSDILDDVREIKKDEFNRKLAEELRKIDKSSGNTE